MKRKYFVYNGMKVYNYARAIEEIQNNGCPKRTKYWLRHNLYFSLFDLSPSCPYLPLSTWQEHIAVIFTSLRHEFLSRSSWNPITSEFSTVTTQNISGNWFKIITEEAQELLTEFNLAFITEPEMYTKVVCLFYLNEMKSFVSFYIIFQKRTPCLLLGKHVIWLLTSFRLSHRLSKARRFA